MQIHQVHSVQEIYMRLVKDKQCSNKNLVKRGT